MHESLNGDLTIKVSVDTNSIDWTPSPSRAVWRKRIHLVGPPESGQVTSVVRYESGSEFPAHDHPGGEEILVLEGVFSDEHGHWPAGTYLLNPEGFRHAPFSEDGCVLFVKLRQYPGRERKHIAIQTDTMPWQPASTPGIETKLLYEQSGYVDTMRLERWATGAAPSESEYGGGAEIFVIDGVLSDELGQHGAGSWIRFPEGAKHAPLPGSGCTLYVKTGGLRYLDSAT